jgi:manganese-dependent ADP-ribose/CDP-alcohol diphosphatase
MPSKPIRTTTSLRRREFLLGVAAFPFAAASVLAAEKNPKPLFTFQAIADVQYADKPQVGARQYRSGVRSINHLAADCDPAQIDFVIHLGDIIDGQKTEQKTLDDLKTIVGAFKDFKPPVRHVVGNHCRNAGDALLPELGLKRSYYDFAPAPGWRAIVLDGTDAGYGVLGDDQLAWLAEQLATAKKSNERVLIFNHFALLKEAAPHHRMKKPEPVLQLLDKYPSTVVAYLAGHQHTGGFTIRKGLPHITVHGLVEYPLPPSHAIVRVFADRLEVEGHGAEPSRLLPFPK